MPETVWLGGCVSLNLTVLIGLRCTNSRSWATASLHTMYCWIGMLVLFALRGRPLGTNPLDWFGIQAMVMTFLMLVVALVMHGIRETGGRPSDEGTGLSPGGL